MGMPIALMAWSLLNRKATVWSSVAVFALALIAIGFKEQGLVLIPLAIVAWWTGAPGAGRRLVASLPSSVWCTWPSACTGAATGLSSSSRWAWATAFWNRARQWRGLAPFPTGCTCITVSTISNVLFAEPTSGLFYITRNLRYGGIETWELVHLGSSVGLTVLIAWWGVRSLRDTARYGWSIESRAFVAMIVVLIACGVLSFDYSRDRLGGRCVICADGVFRTTHSGRGDGLCSASPLCRRRTGNCADLQRRCIRGPDAGVVPSDVGSEPHRLAHAGCAETGGICRSSRQQATNE